MKNISKCFLVLVVFSIWFPFFNVKTVMAQDTIYINSDGSILGTDLIQKIDNTYTFLGNISGKIVVLRDFITIDGCGFTLNGSGALSEKAITLEHRKNVTIQNLVITDYFHGIFCRPGAGTMTNHTIIGNYIANCDIGVEFQGTSNNFVTLNAFKNNSIDVSLTFVLGGNLITQNNFGSYVQVWMSDEPTVDSNYWTDYNGTDADGDGIGDSTYMYHDILRDSHPLMEPVATIPEFSSWLVLPIFLICSFCVILLKKKLYSNR